MCTNDKFKYTREKYTSTEYCVLCSIVKTKDTECYRTVSNFLENMADGNAVHVNILHKILFDVALFFFLRTAVENFLDPFFLFGWAWICRGKRYNKPINGLKWGRNDSMFDVHLNSALFSIIIHVVWGNRSQIPNCTW